MAERVLEQASRAWYDFRVAVNVAHLQVLLLVDDVLAALGQLLSKALERLRTVNRVDCAIGRDDLPLVALRNGEEAEVCVARYRVTTAEERGWHCSREGTRE